MKKLLYLILPQKSYLSTLHRLFYILYDLNILKGKEAFKFHYFVKKIIESNFIVIDIGANLGYFAKNFSRLANKGKVVAIEPLPQFHSVLSKFIGNKNNVELHNVALGQEAGTITMVLPQTNGMLRTGLPHVMRPDEAQTKEKTQEVQMVNTADFFQTFERIDYIKCDIEGHEWAVFSLLQDVLNSKRPIVQLEVDPKNETSIFSLFEQINYLRCGIQDGKCMIETTKHFGGDYLFVPKEKLNLIDKWNA